MPNIFNTYLVSIYFSTCIPFILLLSLRTIPSYIWRHIAESMTADSPIGLSMVYAWRLVNTLATRESEQDRHDGGEEMHGWAVVGGRSGILSRRNRSEWKLRHDSSKERNGGCSSTSFVLLFLFRFFFPHCGVQCEEEGKKSRNHELNRSPKRSCARFRAFDFSRRNDYAIISRRVPFLLKRKTSPFPLALPSLYACNIESLSFSLSFYAYRSFDALSLSRSLPLFLNRRYILSSRFVLTSHRAGSVHFRPTGQPLHTPLTHLDPTKGSSRLFQSIFIIGISPRVYVSRYIRISFHFLLISDSGSSRETLTLFFICASVNWINWTLILIQYMQEFLYMKVFQVILIRNIIFYLQFHN